MNEQSSFQFITDVFNSVKKHGLGPADTMTELIGIIVGMESHFSKITGADLQKIQEGTNKSFAEMRKSHKIYEAMANN